MATIPKHAASAAPRLGLARVAFTSALFAMALLLLCWVAARLGFGPRGHMVVELFSSSPDASLATLILGLCTAFAGGGIAGALFAWIYNLLGPLDPRV